MNAPVELPATRSSRTYHNTGDIRDRNWIPVLHKPSPPPTELPTPYFDALPQFPQRSTSRPGTPKDVIDARRDHTRNGFAPSELDAGPLPLSVSLKQLGPSTTTLSTLRQESRAATPDGGRSVISNGYTASTGAPSTISTQNMMDDQMYTIPGNNLPKDDFAFPPIPLSARTSIASLRRPAVPTSKYNRKPVSNMPETITTNFAPSSRSLPQTPVDSPRLRSITSSERIPTISQYPGPPPVPPEQSSPATSHKLIHSKSTASDRKARALHSHPSSPSIRDPMSVPGTPSFPAPPTHRHRKSTESRKSSIHDYSQPPSAAPQEPLPELPPEARQPSTKERPPTRERSQIQDVSHVQQRHSPPQPPPEAHIPGPPSRSAATLNQHKELAEYMTQKNTVIFRRFDDIHVRVLMALQDEISMLEKELADLDKSKKADSDGRKLKLVGELRRLLGEYDHLHSNWKEMQASKVSEKQKDELSHWLRKTEAGSGMEPSSSAKEDLEWLKKSKDLSSVQVGVSSKGVSSSNETSSSHEKAPIRKNGSNSGGGGGFASFFSCGAKRK